MQLVPVLVVVVAAIGVHAVGSLQRAATLTTNGGKSLDQRQKLSDVVAVGASQDDRERRAVRIRGEVVL